MAPYETGSTPADEQDARPGGGRRGFARHVVPVAVIGVAAATIGLVPALASSGDPDLPKISAKDLLAKIAASDTQRVSGTVRITTDLGLPDLGGLGGLALPSGGADGDRSGASADPGSKLTELASGSHTLRVAADGPEKQKLSILERGSEYSVIRNGDELWAYDSASNQAYHARGTGHGSARAERHSEVPATPQELAEQALKAAGPTTTVTVDGTARVAGRDAYRLLVKPKDAGSSTIGGLTIAVDAENGTPLKATLSPSGDGPAIVDAGYTKVDFGRPAASTFRFTPPKGTEVTDAKDLEDLESLKDLKDLKDLEKLKDFKGFDDLKKLEELKDEEARDRKPDGDRLGKELSGADILGKGWNSIATFTLPDGQGLPTAKSGDLPPEAEQFLDAFGDKVHGAFGTGRLFSTRVINALVTDDGKVYVGAVTKSALLKAADADH